MDISKIQPTENILHILHPKTGERLGITISLMSIADDRMKKIKRQLQDKRLQLEKRGKNFTATQIEENSNVLLFAAMTGWSWGVPTDEKDKPIEGKEAATFKGENPAFKQEKVFEVFNELEWFRDQVDEKVGDGASFF